jgi:phage terminase large subunit-like protein
MTETEIEALREKKNETASNLRDMDFDHYKPILEGTDQRLRDYAELVRRDPDGHNIYELLGLERFFKMADGYGWKKGRVRRFFDCYEMLRFNGQNGRQSYKLTPIQCFQFANIFGFSREDGLRLIRDAYLFVPRKFSKTTSAASLAFYELLFGPSNAQAFVGANSYTQAKLCFDEIRAIARDYDSEGEIFQINREKIFYKTSLRDAYARCLASNPKTLDGLNASLVIMDEYSQARNTQSKNGADLKNVLTSSMGARSEPLTVVITTASEVIDGPFVHELEGVKKVLRGEAPELPTMFASIFEPDAWDREDDPNTWRKVQPHLGVTVRPDYYEIEWQRAQISAENMVTFRTKLLNVFAINEKKSWFSVDKANSLMSDWDIDKVPHGLECVVSFDLSVHDDFSAVAYTFYEPKNYDMYSHVDYYFPEGALEGHPNKELYRLWHEKGYLKFCNGDVIDVRMIAEDIIRRSRNLRIIRIAYDSYKAQDLTNILATFGRNVLQPYKQTYGAFNLPVESFEYMAWLDPPKIKLSRNPITSYCLYNCMIDEDRLKNKKPIKISQYRKIDGAIVILMGVGSLNEYER